MPAGEEPWRASSRKVSARCGISSDPCRAICGRPSVPASGAAVIKSATRSRAEFESQFSYADDLFEEVFDSNAIHVRYPLLFLNQRAPGHGDLGPEIHLDLVEANRRQLEDAGLREEHISVIDGCTACDTTRFFSHRAEFGKTGRMMAVIGISPD